MPTQNNYREIACIIKDCFVFPNEVRIIKELIINRLSDYFEKKDENNFDKQQFSKDAR